ncbi:hypothetical protein Pars_0299 [Pyrobaculum arsenaticum DSM 13514]|uniref:Uncharacterized protein n=1 Tax=Pyrobaculum arsenaticum (strain DSM 13514 / JCM 11321 / PZ6) TaxID=340102 RepID=A4WHP5_PYRAR|nr:hypothetical protein Pars_0299 [Pyrobaculum arsenaticum DSM 13514]
MTRAFVAACGKWAEVDVEKVRETAKAGVELGRGRAYHSYRRSTAVRPRSNWLSLIKIYAVESGRNSWAVSSQEAVLPECGVFVRRGAEYVIVVVHVHNAARCLHSAGKLLDELSNSHTVDSPMCAYHNPHPVSCRSVVHVKYLVKDLRSVSQAGASFLVSA